MLSTPVVNSSTLQEPLASALRPNTLSDFVGQAHIFGSGKPLRVAIESQQLHSMLFWGPPGVGKTTLAHLIANSSAAALEHLSAVLSGVKDIRAAVERAQQRQQVNQQATILFVDEVHRFNKAQQDAFLPFVEDGTVTFIGATTENPSFELNNALLSRCRLYVLKPLETADLEKLIDRGLQQDANAFLIDDAIKQRLAESADGDARRLLNVLELAMQLSESSENGEKTISSSTLDTVLQDSWRKFDKSGDVFYEQISALHKAVRGSAPDATLYWFSRMIDGGCDPLYIARRMLRMASEDIGNADPRALGLALDAWQTFERLGSPEGELAIAQALLYMACAPKSNAVYMAYKACASDILQQRAFEVPEHLRNAPTSLHKKLGYGEEYRYPHDEPEAYAAGENYLPEAVKDAHYYRPSDRGLEQKIKAKLAHLSHLDRNSAVQRYEERRDNS
ncbi:MAG: replication-associated recombination protein A [Pseudomonadota bacterium]